MSSFQEVHMLCCCRVACAKDNSFSASDAFGEAKQGAS